MKHLSNPNSSRLPKNEYQNRTRGPDDAESEDEDKVFPSCLDPFPKSKQASLGFITQDGKFLPPLKT